MKRFQGLYYAFVYFFLYLPIVVLVVNAVNSNRYGLKWDGFTLKWFSAMLQNDGLMEAAGNSMLIAVSSATLVTALGGISAVVLYLYRFRGRKIISGLLMIMMMIPDIILAIAMLVLFILMGVPLGFWSLLLAHITFCLPFSVVTVMSRLQGLDPSLLDAARDLGASESQTMKRVVFPLLRPALFGSWLLCFTLSVDDVIVSSFVTGPSFDVLPLKIFSMVKVGVKPEVNALAAVFILGSILLVILSQFLTKEQQK